jgi:hypothetical protein
MCEAETTMREIEEFVQLLGKVSASLETVYWDEMNRIRQGVDASDSIEEQPPSENA